MSDNAIQKDILGKEITKQCRELTDILKEGRQEENFIEYLVVQIQGKYNMLDDRARQLTGLSKEDYKYIRDNYSTLINKYPRARKIAESRLNYMKSAEISKRIAIKGCNNCIEIVSNKLDVTIDDLCNECKGLIK